MTSRDTQKARLAAAKADLACRSAWIAAIISLIVSGVCVVDLLMRIFY